MGVPFHVVVKKLSDDVYGETDGIEATIFVCNSLTKEQQWRVFLHEWTHAVFYVTGVANVIEDSVEEIIAQSMEHALVQLINQMEKI